MTLVKWREPGSLLSDMLDNFFEPGFPTLRDTFSTGLTMPAVNTKETDTAYELEIAVPGMAKDDFDVDINDNVMTISVEKEDSDEETTDDYTRKEFSYSSFRRSFTIPKNVDKDAIDASYNNGILCIKLPKSEEVAESGGTKVAVN